MSPLKQRHHVQLVHFDSAPGKPPVFFIKIQRDGDPAQCQKLVPLDLGGVGALLLSIDAAMKAHNTTRRAQLLATERMMGNA